MAPKVVKCSLTFIVIMSCTVPVVIVITAEQLIHSRPFCLLLVLEWGRGEDRLLD